VAKHSSGSDNGRRALGRWLLVVAGLGMLATAVGFGVSANRKADDESRDRTLSAQVSAQSQLLVQYFDRARAVVLVTAQNPAFRNFYEAFGSRKSKIAAGGPLMDDVNAALTFLQTLYPNQVLNAVSFINRDGAENARVVKSRRIGSAELDIGEFNNPFFDATFAISPGKVYQAAPYVSSDTHQWVISNSTPLPSEFGTLAILHFEVSLDSFRSVLSGAGASHTMIVDADTGDIVLDLDRPLRQGEPLGDPQGRSFQMLAGAKPNHGLVSADSKRIAYQAVATGPDNVNHWLVVAEIGIGDDTFAGFGLGPSLMVLSALSLLVFALLSWRIHTRRLADAAVTDALTGLPNRVLFHDRVTQGIHLASRKQTCAAVLLLDLDRFKDVNDTLGHHKGDLLLIEVAARLRSVVRDCDTVARLGGDEFAVFVPETGRIDGASATAARILAAISAPYAIDGVSIRLGASIGIASFPDGGKDTDMLIQHSDVAMYQAKRRHQGFVEYRPEKDRHTERRLRLAAELSSAIANGELIVNYQPKIDLATGKAAGLEALVRWPHPELGLILPDEFISIAEDTGLIRPLTMTVLDQSLQQCRSWKKQGCEQHVSVNLSARSLVDSDLPQAVGDLLQRYGIDGNSLTFEITETAIIADQDSAASIFNAFHNLGIGLSIDDFGTGYFSLSELRDLPIDEIKIDRGFVSAMSSDEKDAFIVRSTIALGQNLGMRVVAEGVEDQTTLDELRWLGCDYAQGFLMSRPLSGDAVMPWLLAWQQRHDAWEPASNVPTPAGV
jgi:diguanylate cyclase (GGDEF)-like protein